MNVKFQNSQLANPFKIDLNLKMPCIWHLTARNFKGTYNHFSSLKFCNIVYPHSKLIADMTEVKISKLQTSKSLKYGFEFETVYIWTFKWSYFQWQI